MDRIIRISDDEMRTLMKEVVNKLYTALVNLDDEAFMAALLPYGARQTLRWDEPEIVRAFLFLNEPPFVLLSLPIQRLSSVLTHSLSPTNY